jgi:hypothetical protein
VSLLGLMSLFSGSALAVGPPIVTVNATSNFSLNTATLNGTVDANTETGGASYKFEYGKTKLYGKSTSVKNLGNGITPVSNLLVGLEPMTTYHVRLSATNKYGTTVSEDKTFEMLLSWKIGGKFPLEFSEPPITQSEHGEDPITLERTVGANLYKIACKSNFTGSMAVLGKEYNLPFRNCKVYINGKEQKECITPPEKILHLDAFAATTKNEYLEFGLECPIGEKILISGGFAIGAATEQVNLIFTLTEALLGGWTLNYGPVEWHLTGALKGFKYGVS